MDDYNHNPQHQESSPFNFQIENIKSPSLQIIEKHQSIEKMCVRVRSKLMGFSSPKESYFISAYEMKDITYSQFVLHWHELYPAHPIKIKTITDGNKNTIGYRFNNRT